MTAKSLNIQFDDNMTARIERMAERLQVAPADFGLFSIIKAVEDLENLERVVSDPDLKTQAAELVQLHKTKKINEGELSAMLLELLEVVAPKDTGWGDEA